ncbi:hypothetical protein ABI59_20250 [Acidobacteria bacterium Mor1]|nr:hypothetical protein ABI59_20250 [Acidobacteria bacterium Mor1]
MSPAVAGVEQLGKVAVTDGIAAWNEALLKRYEALEADGLPEDGYLECRMIEEIDRVYLCASRDDGDMNRALVRASAYVEGLDGNPQGTILDPAGPAVARIAAATAGHDLKRADLLRFYEDLRGRCESEPAFCPTPHERALFEGFILPLAADESPFVIIAYPVVVERAGQSWHWIVSHEVLHAQYFMQPEYRETVDEFWRYKVEDSDKAFVKRFLGQTYDVSDELLLINEFQAYTLQAGNENNKIPFIYRYRKKIEAALAALGKPELKPIQVLDTAARSAPEAR